MGATCNTLVASAAEVGDEDQTEVEKPRLHQKLRPSALVGIERDAMD